MIYYKQGRGFYTRKRTRPHLRESGATSRYGVGIAGRPLISPPERNICALHMELSVTWTMRWATISFPMSAEITTG
jgi:hypothetical protein